MNRSGGYMYKILRVDLADKKIIYEVPEETVLRKYIGGTGLGIYYLYREVPPSVEPFDPGNRILLMTGPLSRTIGPTGGYSIVTKGPLNNASASSQAQGKFGACVKSCGLDGLIIQGTSEKMVYLYVGEDKAEIRDAEHLRGKDTLETAEALEKELGGNERTLSILAMGPAGENLVYFASVVNDRGHVAAHNGIGAVFGSKNLKAIVCDRGTKVVNIRDKENSIKILKDMMEDVKKGSVYSTGTSNSIKRYYQTGLLAFKNYSSFDDFEPYSKMVGSYYRENFIIQKDPCYGCGFNHCHRITVTEGPFKGLTADEPEYEGWATWGPLIGQTDAGTAIYLNDLADRLGLDLNESGWISAWVMECSEKGLLPEEFTGLNIQWGDAAKVASLLKDIANRRGIGNLLAEGLLRTATRIGGEAAEIGIYTKKGNTPRTHDHRTSGNHILDTTMASVGVDEIGDLLSNPTTMGLPTDTDRNTAEGAASLLAASNKEGFKYLFDSFVFCYLGVKGASKVDLVNLLNSVTGWNYTIEEATIFALRVNALLRVYGYLNGHTKQMEEPSARYASAAISGPLKGRKFSDEFALARDLYYEKMGWDVETGKPLPETLNKLELDFVIKDIWPEYK